LGIEPGGLLSRIACEGEPPGFFVGINSVTRDTNGFVVLPTWFLAVFLAAALTFLGAFFGGGVSVYSDVKVIKTQVQSLDGRMERMEDAARVPNSGK